MGRGPSKATPYTAVLKARRVATDVNILSISSYGRNLCDFKMERIAIFTKETSLCFCSCTPDFLYIFFPKFPKRKDFFFRVTTTIEAEELNEPHGHRNFFQKTSICLLLSVQRYPFRVLRESPISWRMDLSGPTGPCVACLRVVTCPKASGTGELNGSCGAF